MRTLEGSWSYLTRAPRPPHERFPTVVLRRFTDLRHRCGLLRVPERAVHGCPTRAHGRSLNPMTAAAIETHDLHMHYGAGRTEVRALDGVDLTIEEGEMVAIMGPSGSGKSTLLHIVGALESPTSGTLAVGGVHFEGLDDKQLTELRRDHIGFVFQFFNLLPSLTAEENVTLPAVIAKRRDPAIRERARALLDRVGLSDRMDHLPAELYGGQQQRVAIARA